MIPNKTQKNLQSEKINYVKNKKNMTYHIVYSHKKTAKNTFGFNSAF